MLQEVTQTHEEKVKMYSKLTKRELIEMLIVANNVLANIPPQPVYIPQYPVAPLCPPQPYNPVDPFGPVWSSADSGTYEFNPNQPSTFTVPIEGVEFTYTNK